MTGQHRSTLPASLGAAALLLAGLSSCKDAEQAEARPAVGETAGAQASAPGAADPAAAVPGPQVSKGSTYRHPAGFSFWYPQGWKVVEADDGLQLVPPDAKANADGPLEAYLLIGDSAKGIARPDDPQVIAYLDQALRQSVPFLKRGGPPELFDTDRGKGAAMDWEGSNPKGLAVVARAYVTLIKGWGIALVALGERALIEQRDPVVRKVFSSFGLEAGQTDPALVGTWELVSTSAITNNSPFETAWTRAQAVNEQTSRLTLRADGTWTRVDKRHMLVGAAGIWLEDKSSSSAEGTWSAGQGSLYLIWKDKSWEDYRYRLEGNRLRLASDRQGEVWQRGG